METILSLCLGLGLSAACGFRVFVPWWFLSVAAWSGHVNLAPEFHWIGTYPALLAFSVATVLEIAAYYVPWLDHFLDSLATPIAVVAGMVITASVATDLSPFLKWTMAVIAGGGFAGAVQGMTVLARGTSLVGSGGLTNPVVSTAELGGSLLTSLGSLIVPALTVAIVVLGLFFAGRRLWRLRRKVAVG